MSEIIGLYIFILIAYFMLLIFDMRYYRLVRIIKKQNRSIFYLRKEIKKLKGED